MNIGRTEILHLENQELAARWYSDASMEVAVKKTGVYWNSGPVGIQETGPAEVGHVWLRNERSSCEQYPARFIVKREGEAFRVSVLDQRGATVGTLRCSWSLDEGSLCFSLLEADASLPSLIFPTPFHAASLVVPQGIGRWYRKPVPGRWLHRFNILSMRWFGGLSTGDDHGYVAIFTKGHQDAGISIHQTCISPLWLKSLGQWAGERTVTYRFVTGGYVGLAREYRKWAIDVKLHKPLTEKIRACPNAGSMLGGREVGFFLGRTIARSRYEDGLEAVMNSARTSGSC